MHGMHIEGGFTTSTSILYGEGRTLNCLMPE